MSEHAIFPAGDGQQERIRSAASARPRARWDRASRTIRIGFAISAAVTGLVGAGCSGDGTGNTPEQTTEASAGGEWKVGSCATPDPENPPDGYKVVDCDDASATVKVLALTDPSILGEEPDCPPGTDIILNIETIFGPDDEDRSGLPTDTACLRNLSGDHPGDPGMGGGQLVVQDCIALPGGSIEETRCDGTGSLPPEYTVVGLTTSSAECPPQTTDPIELSPSLEQKFTVICGQRFG